MAELDQDPSANTGRFRAFVEQAEDGAPRSRVASRGLLIGVGAVLAVVVIIVLVLAIG